MSGVETAMIIGACIVLAPVVGAGAQAGVKAMGDAVQKALDKCKADRRKLAISLTNGTDRTFTRGQVFMQFGLAGDSPLANLPELKSGNATIIRMRGKNVYGMNGVIMFELGGDDAGRKLAIAFDVKDWWGNTFNWLKWDEVNNYDVKVCGSNTGNIQHVAKHHDLADNERLWHAGKRPLGRDHEIDIGHGYRAVCCMGDSVKDCVLGITITREGVPCK